MTRTKLSKVLEIIGWSVALIVLIAAIVYFNFFVKEEVKEIYNIGDKAPSFEIEVYKSKGSEGGIYSNKNESKILVLNFWYTTCGPCLKELPYFDEIQSTYSNWVKIVALHSYEVDEDVDKQEFINDGYADFNIIFGQDTEELKLFNKLGGKSSYPMTVIIDGNGIIRYAKTGGITTEELSAKLDIIIQEKLG